MILKDYKVVRPKTTKVQKDSRRNISYVYQVVESVYDPVRKFNVDKRKIIGKMVDDVYMIPNKEFEIYYPDLMLKEEPRSAFSDTIHVGAVTLFDYLFKETKLDIHLEEIFPDKYKLIEDLIMYMIKEETCTYEYFPYFEREIPTLTRKVYSDSSISRLLNENISSKDINDFLEEWNKTNSDINEVYINYDSTNIGVRGDFDGLGEYGYAKDDDSIPQVNISYVVAKPNNRPLSYALYPGSIHDSSEVDLTLKVFKKYNYKNIGFIFDRAYYSKRLVKKLKKDNHFFIMMLKEDLDFVKELIEKHRIKLTDQYDCYISDYDVSGIKERINIASKDEKPIMVYLYVFYSASRATIEKQGILNTIAEYEKEIADHFENDKTAKEDTYKKYEKYFKFKYDTNGYLLNYKKDEKKIKAALNNLGFFSIMAEKEMEPRDILITYKERDSIEKLFRALKSSLDFDHVGVYTKRSLEAKVFITFLASIIRNEIFQYSKKLKLEERKNLTVPIILRELNNIEATINNQNTYIRRYSLTKKQKKILGLFNIFEKQIDETISSFSNDISTAKQW